MSFLALLSLTVCGYGLCHHVSRRWRWVSNSLIEAGAGFFIAAAIVSAVLSASWAPISQLSLALAGIGGVISILIIASWFTESNTRVLRFVHPTQFSTFAALLLLMLAAYLLLILINNLYREIFPWDAFTTWMYRAKAWVLSQSATDFAPLDQWLGNDGRGLTLAAAHYPLAVSALAAFASALTGDWSDQLASLPWFFASVANALLMAGLCRTQHPESTFIPVIGATALISTPLVHMHGLLAGYADIWIMGTSGMGLAGLCIWAQHRSTGLLNLSCLLLILGCLFKLEGGLWLALGIGFVATHYLWRRLGTAGVGVVLATLIALGLIQPLHLGTLGVWGINADGIQLGTLAKIGLRPYNPVADYLTMTFWQGNFLLLLPLYFVALVAILCVAPRRLAGYLLMGAGIFATHGIVFGLSDYSEYAQIGTAINRVLLQTLPVFIITICAVTATNPTAGNESSGASVPTSAAALGSGALLTLLTATLALPLTLLLISTGPGSSTGDDTHRDTINDHDRVLYPASNLTAVVGALSEGERGYQFRGSDIPIGVAKAGVDDSGSIQPRYLIAETWMATPGTVSFYWINTDAPRVHSLPIETSGQSVIDMATYEDFWQRPIREMGYLVQPLAFDTTALGSLTLTDSLFDAIPALANHWMSPAPVSQRLINMTTGHERAPITLQSWLTVTFLLMLGVVLGLGMVSRNFRGPLRQSLFTGIGLLWFVGSLAHANQAIHLTAPLLAPAAPPARGTMPDGSTLQPLATAILEVADTVDQPVLTLGIDDQGRFDAQRMPFMLLPMSAAAITEPQLAQISSTLKPIVLLFGQNGQQLNAIAQRLSRSSNLQFEREGRGYMMLQARAQ